MAAAKRLVLQGPAMMTTPPTQPAENLEFDRQHIAIMLHMCRAIVAEKPHGMVGKMAAEVLAVHALCEFYVRLGLVRSIRIRA